MDWLKDGHEYLLTDLREHLDSESWDDVGAILDDYFHALSLTAPDAVHEVWSRIPRAWLREHPRRLLASAMTRAASKPFSLIEERTERLFAEWVEAQESPATRDLLSVKAAAIRRNLVSGRFDRAIECADQAQEVLRCAPDHDGFDDILGSVLLSIGLARLLSGDVARAIESFSEGWRWSSTVSHPIAPYLAGHCALSHALAGDFAHAEKWLARSRTAPTTNVRNPAVRLQDARMFAEALIGVGRLDRHAAEGSALGHGIETSELGWVGTHVRARTALYWGDGARAAREIESELHAYPSLTGTGSLAGMILRADLSDIRQSQGDLEAAAAALTAVDSPRAHPAVVSSKARILMVQGRARDAVSLLDSAARRRRSAMTTPARWEILRANAAHLTRSGDRDDAVRIAAERIEHTRAYDAAQDALPAVHEAIAARTRLPAKPSKRLAQPPNAALTPREEQILQLLRTHDSVRSLAEAMFISSNTAKSHLRNLYRKLGASSRLDALRRAGLTTRAD